MGILNEIQKTIGKTSKFSDPRLMTPRAMVELIDDYMQDISYEDFFDHIENETLKASILEWFVGKSEEVDPYADEDGIVTDKFDAFMDSAPGEAHLDFWRGEMEALAKDDAEEAKYGHPSLSAAERNR